MATFDDERIRAMLRGRRDVRRYPFPGLEGVEVGIRILSDDDLDNARLEAQRYSRKVKADLEADPDFIARETERQIVWRSCVDPEDTSAEPRRFFPSDADVRTLDSVTVRTLLDSYMEHQEYVYPWNELDESEVGALVEALGKERTPGVLLAHFAPDTLRRCVRTMARMLRGT
ncbi:MAG: hypothetical protein RID81_07175 [Sandaracinaceae bacterium]